MKRPTLGKSLETPLTSEEFGALNQDTNDIERLAADVVTLAERIVIPRTVFSGDILLS